MVNILGVNLSNLSLPQVLQITRSFFSSPSRHYIVTPNPEIILTAQKDEEFLNILNNANLALADGIGLKFAGLLLGTKLTRITGADFVKDIYAMAQELNLKVLIINRSDGLSDDDDISNYINANYKIDFLIIDRDLPVNNNKESLLIDNIALDKINSFRPHICLCTLGAPAQEKFIFHNLKNLHTVRLAIGIGGALDFLTGRTKRAPYIIRFIGLEWLWRLYQQPWQKKLWRLKRIFAAVIIFPAKVIYWRLFQNNK